MASTNPFFRWSFVKMFLNFGHVMKHWQAGDGREAKLVAHVLGTAPPGDAAAAIRAIDDFGYNTSFLMNVGDEKGRILDEAVKQARPKRILELGTYCGYSALRMSQAAPDAQILAVEFSADNARPKPRWQAPVRRCAPRCLALPRDEQEAAQAWFERHNLACRVEEFRWIGWRGLFVHDPDGNTVELVAYDASLLDS
jgi:hypothetical protein